MTDAEGDVIHIFPGVARWDDLASLQRVSPWASFPGGAGRQRPGGHGAETVAVRTT